MNQSKNENFIVLLVSLVCICLMAEGMFQKWEFWVPPLILIGTISLWGIVLSEKVEFAVRKVYDLLYVMLVVFFYSIHSASLFDIAIVMTLVMVAFSLFDHIYMLNLLLAEYVVIMVVQFILATREQDMRLDAVELSRIMLHMVIVALVYSVCVRTISDRMEKEEADRYNQERVETFDADMEDFLSNISHELRTPVNVVNGMSDFLIRRNAGAEAYSIKDAGIRLAYQIEDIQDYTECKRKSVLLEEGDYLSTSLINDVVTSFRFLDDSSCLELVVDLDPSVPTKLKGDIRKLQKIFRHLLENAVKFTERGGIYVKMYAESAEYGVNLCIEMTDTGIGMTTQDIEAVAESMYQVNKKRNRASGGIGLGLFIVYGFTHRMGGFVKIVSEKNNGTTVRVTIPQKVADASPCIALSGKFEGNILFHVRSDKYKVPKVRDFYRNMATNLAMGIHVPLYSAETIKEIERFREKMDVTHIFMGQDEYEEHSEYFDSLCEGDIVVAVSAYPGFRPNPGSKVMIMPKPLYAYPVIKILNEGIMAGVNGLSYAGVKPVLRGVRALVVDDEPMNLVVARSLFSNYEMITDTAASGREAIQKFRTGEYDIVFMDHMMPEMDGVEAMKQIKQAAIEAGREIKVIALTANVVSGAREMFKKEGFDGFIAKPIHSADFERVMLRLLPESGTEMGGAGV